MVKRQKEKLYQSSREHKANAALRAGGSGLGTATDASAGAAASSASRRLLPFSHCALTLTAYETPVCNAQGIVFENSAIIPFVFKHGMDPCTGQKMTTRDLITLHMHQQNDEKGGGNSDASGGGGGGGGGGQCWACPILNKPFVQHSKIVAIILPNNDTDGSRHANVYSWQAYQELNVKANHYEDLISGQPFDKTRDVLILYDPNDDDLNRRRDINTFFHIQNARQLQNSKDGGDNKRETIQHGMTATRIMQQLAKNKQEKQQQAAAQESKKRAAAEAAATAVGEDANHEQQGNNNKRMKFNPDGAILARDVTGVRYTTTGGAASFTSTGVGVHLDDCDRPATEEEILQAQLLVLKQGKSNITSNDGNGSKKKLQHQKGLVRIVTNMGDITVELHCDIAPRTCYNFLGLCRHGSYNGSKFHRLIPNFMIQGGKQAAAAVKDSGGGSSAAITEDESFWGNRPFADEFDDRLKHDAPGILSMANSGPNTNRRQFFFTFKACTHLNRKHSVFGHVMDGMQVLQEMEKIPTNTDAKKDHVPLTKIVIQSTIILVDPVQEAIQLEQERLAGIIAARKKQAAAQAHYQTTTTPATSKLLQGAEEKDSNTAAATTSSNSNNDDVGHFLREQLKQRAAASVAAKKKKPVKETVEEPQVLPPASRRPPPPPKTTTNFGNFSGW